MGEVVDCVENGTSTSLGDKHTRTSERRVAHKGAVDAGKTNVLESKRGGRFFSDGTLILSEVCKVDVGERVGYHVYDCRFRFVIVLTGEGICDDVFQTGNVCDVHCEFADESKVVPLSIGDGVASFKECAHQRLLIRKNPEFPSFQHVAELDDRRVDREEFEIVCRVPRFGRRGSTAEKSEGLETSFYDLVDGARDGLGARVGVGLQVGVRNRMEEECGCCEALFGESVGERPHCLCYVREESLIEIDEAEETLKGFDGAWALETPYGIDFFRERPDASCRDVVAEELHIPHAEYAFAHIEDQSQALLGVKQAPKIALLLFGGGRGH